MKRMKRYLPYILLIPGFFSCNKSKDDSMFSERADQRIEKALLDYEAKLTAAPYGWKLKIIPAGQGNDRVFYYWVRFNDKNRVICRFGNKEPLESSYRLKALQRPELIFDTYTYLHDLADPESLMPGALTGKGLSSDFEFEIISATADSIILNGKYNGSVAKLLKAAPTDSAGSDALAPYTGVYGVVGSAFFYNGPEPGGEPAIISIPREKIAIALVEANTIGINYANQVDNGWMYRITFDPDGNKITRVTPSKELEKNISPGSFKVLGFSYNSALKQIYLKTSYINSNNKYREVEETLTLK
jgi:hypothetical protein